MVNYTTNSTRLNLTQFANSDALFAPIHAKINNLTAVLSEPDILIVTAFSHMLGRPGLIDLYKEPVKYISVNAVNFSADLNYNLLSKISALFTDLINNVIQLSGSSTLHNQLVEPLKYFTTVGGGPTPVINLLTLTPHTLILYYTTKKMKNNVLDIFHPLSILSKGVITGKWADQINRTNSPERGDAKGYRMSAKISHEYTVQELGLNILIQFGFAAVWGALAFSTYKGMSNAIEATGSVTAQHAFNLLTNAIALSQLPISRIWNRIKTQPKHALPHYPPSFETNDHIIDINDNPYTYTKPQESPYKSNKSNYSIQTYDPIALEKRRQEIAQRSGNYL